MSIIMPAGNGRSDWSPNKGLNKTASTGTEETDKNLLYEAAKKVVAELGGECCGPLGGDDFQVDLVDDGGLGSEVSEVADEVEDVVDDVEGDLGGDLGGDLDAVDGSVEEAVESAEVALEEAVDALQDVKDAVGGDVDVIDDVDDGLDDEIEVEVEIDEAPVIDDGDDNGDDDNGDDELIIESEDDKCDACDGTGHKAVENQGNTYCASSDDEPTESSTEEAELEKEASSNEFVKMSAISPTNRKKLYDYWTKQLDYPKDWVKLMVKDYEK
jgi:hypothetical protein